jgi:hypothetical protein
LNLFEPLFIASTYPVCFLFLVSKFFSFKETNLLPTGNRFVEGFFFDVNFLPGSSGFNSLTNYRLFSKLSYSLWQSVKA